MLKGSEVVKHELLRYSGVLIILFLWDMLPKFNLVNEYYLPSLSHVISTIIDLFYNKYLFMNIMVSVWRVMMGLMISGILGSSIGIMLGFYFKNICEKAIPLFRIFSQINPYALYPLFIVIFGIGENGKIGIVLWTSIWPILFHSITGAKSADIVLIKTAQSMGISKIGLFIKVLLPMVLPSIFQGLRVGIEISFIILIAAEMSGTTVGLGYMVHTSGLNYVIDELYAAGLCILIISVIFNKSILWLKQKIDYWSIDVSYENNKDTSKIKPLTKKNVILILFIIILIFVVGIIEIQNSKQFLINNTSFEG
ncbi:MAG: ABC transporter permease [Clostridium sp.]